jgi:hypothetical protein
VGATNEWLLAGSGWQGRAKQGGSVGRGARPSTFLDPTNGGEQGGERGAPGPGVGAYQSQERLECLARVWSSPRWISMFNRAAGNDGAGEEKDGRRGTDLDLHEPREEIIKP